MLYANNKVATICEYETYKATKIGSDSPLQISNDNQKYPIWTILVSEYIVKIHCENYGYNTVNPRGWLCPCTHKTTLPEPNNT